MALKKFVTPKGKVITIDDDGVVFSTGNEPAVAEPTVSPVAAQMFNRYQAISIGNMQQRAVGVRTRLQQWTIDSYFRNAIQMGYQLGIIPMPKAESMDALQAFGGVPAVSDSPELKAVSDRQDKMEAQFKETNELIAAIAAKVGVGD